MVKMYCRQKWNFIQIIFSGVHFVCVAAVAAVAGVFVAVVRGQKQYTANN